MDEINMEPAENLKPLEDIEVQKEQPAPPTPWAKKMPLPGYIAIAILLFVAIYFIFFTSSEIIIAQPVSFDITSDPAVLIISVTNKEEGQASIIDISPGYYERKNANLVLKSFSTMIEGKTLPLSLNHGEVNVIKMTFHIDKTDLAAHCDSLQDSSHIVVSDKGLSKNQLEGYLGFSWRVLDSDGNSYINNIRLIYFVLAPSPEGSTDLMSIVKSELISAEPFELCTQLEEE